MPKVSTGGGRIRSAKRHWQLVNPDTHRRHQTSTGNATVTVKGTATGQADKTATFQLTVNPAAAGGFTLAANPATLPIQQGTGGTSTVTITRTGGFAGAVTLTATGVPNGVTAVFDPTAPTTNSSTLTLTASATAATGAATVTIHGNATGLNEQTTTLALTVNPAAGGSAHLLRVLHRGPDAHLARVSGRRERHMDAREPGFGHEVPVQHHAGEGWRGVRDEYDLGGRCECITQPGRSTRRLPAA
jgi:hypothetical protein